MKTLYTAHATNTGGRSGHVESDDKRLVFDLTPANSKTGTNPEQLFAAGYSACFGSAVDAVLKKMSLTTSDKPTIAVSVDLNQDDSGYSIAATLDITLPGLDESQAQQVVEAAHQMCPYSKATRGNIPVALKVSGKPLAQAA